MLFTDNMKQTHIKKYEQVCTLNQLYELNNDDYTNTDEWNRLISINNASIVNNKEPLVLTKQGLDYPVANVISMVRHGNELVCVISDDDGNLHIIQNEKQAKKFSGNAEFYVSISLNYWEKYSRVVKKYGKNDHPDVYKMIDRLIELGEGD